jgi:hypothetical protein
MKIKNLILSAFLLFFIFSACNNNEDPKPGEKTGQLRIDIVHTVDGNPLVTNQLIYVNAASNEYLVTEVQWFISDLRLIKPSGDVVPYNYNEGIFYVDTDIAETFYINPDFKLPAGDYKGIAFTFGFSEEQNISNRFVNPPESFMFWPEYLGGGYHYMKLNGKWKNLQGQLANFNFHLGIGQVYDTTASKSQMTDLNTCCLPMHCTGFKPPEDGKILPVIDFIHNHFEVVFDELPFTVTDGGTTNLTLNMKIENWFQTPHVYDHNHWGGSIMQNQDAMQTGCENGWDVFEMKVVR